MRPWSIQCDRGLSCATEFLSTAIVLLENGQEHTNILQKLFR
jgi:hypothetical protein